MIAKITKYLQRKFNILKIIQKLSDKREIYPLLSWGKRKKMKNTKKERKGRKNNYSKQKEGGQKERRLRRWTRNGKNSGRILQQMLPRYVRGKIIGVLISEENKVFFLFRISKCMYMYFIIIAFYFWIIIRQRVILEMNRIGMLVDLAHVSQKTMSDVLDITTAPIIFSHSSAYAVCNNDRNVPDYILKRMVIRLYILHFIHEFIKQSPRLFIRRL